MYLLGQISLTTNAFLLWIYSLNTISMLAFISDSLDWINYIIFDFQVTYVLEFAIRSFTGRCTYTFVGIKNVVTLNI